MEFFNQTYVALRGPTGAPQTASDTIGRLSDRLSPSTLLADRRAAVLALKGLSRDCKADVGASALPGLLDVLYNDAEVDSDIGKAVLETLNILCDVDDQGKDIAGFNQSKDIGFRHTDTVLVNDKTAHALFALLVDNNFYIRLATLHFLGTLLQNRRQMVQQYFLTAKNGPTGIISVLEDKREIIRNEAITMIQALISQSPDIQKILAFEGAFEKLFNTVRQEGGLDGGIVAQEALTCVDMLLRYNSSNQSYFHETGLPPGLCELLLFPINLPMNEAAPQEFALQFWDSQKMANASYVVSIMGMLINSKGSAQELIFTRCLVELALASNAPTSLKTQALHLLPSSLNSLLFDISLTPYMPVPETNGEEWDRLEPASALDALVELALHGEYNGLDGGKRLKDGLELRAAAATVFENFVRKEEIRHAIIAAMVPPQNTSPHDMPPTPLLIALASAPDTSSPSLDPAVVTSTHLATFLFSHLLRSSPQAKKLALAIMPSSQPAAMSGGQFFVPADGAPSAEPEPEDDEQQSLLQTLSENLSLAFLERSRADTSDRDKREWDRLIVGYLSMLAQWLWEEPASVREFLNAGGLGVLVEQVNQVSEIGSILPGLCAFLLGICYEFNREPGEITRATIHPILNRLGVDTLAGRMARLREDERFKSVGPESVVLPYPTPSSHLHAGVKPDVENEAEIWFDWAFIDFWKSNYYSVQRGLGLAPDQISSSGQNAETTMLIASLRDVIRTQSGELETLRKQLKEKSSSEEQVAAQQSQVASLQSQVASLSAELSQSEEKRKDVEKEQEDLLVLLDEVSAKRKLDKVKMREAGLEVSEDEGDDDDDE
ncbi:p115 like vesicle tethering protein [Mycena floridula]|nr:p115 like vesicle tethering protein [Mycena floridula]